MLATETHSTEKKPGLVRRLLDSQIRLSNRVDAALWPKEQLVDGYQDFKYNLVPEHLGQDLHIVDIGGGKRPYLTPERKAALNATVTGIDIDDEELALAPAGSYDKSIACDISQYREPLNADLVICMAAMEHIENMEGTFTALSSLLKPGGKAVIFMPSRNACFAVLNRVLPESFKRKLLYAAYPESEASQGFKAFYQQCTPNQIEDLAKRNGLKIAEERNYYYSWYFEVLFPAHFVWRLWMQLFMRINRRQASETFAMVLEKEA